jgi:hypothetical protein
MNAEAPPRPRPSDGIRALYRTLIKLCHPDLAVSDTDRLRREEFTARVNAAYAAGDAARLEALAREWQTGIPDASRTPAQASELRVAVEAVRRQLAEVRAEIARLAAAGLGEWLGADDTQDAVRRLTGLVRSELRRQQDALRRLRSRL